MKILIGHNHYQQPGGEDAVAATEVEILRQQGHDVLYVEFDNKDFNALSVPAKIQNVLTWDWSKKAYDLVLQHCVNFKPDLAHFHNTFYMMTPSVYSACQSRGVPVVQTLHNFRLLCSNGLFYREGKVCEECLSHTLKRGIKYGCYRQSRGLTWAVVNMLEKHRRLGTWQNRVDLFIALTDFARNKFMEGGLPAEKIVVKPNTIAFDPGFRKEAGDHFVFAGRLSEEKGIKIVLETFRHLPAEKLMVLGDGPLKTDCEAMIKTYGLKNVRLLGHLDKKDYYETLKKAKALIVPSRLYENFPVVMIEAYACGVPVIASRLGSMKEIVVDHQTGLLFDPGDPEDLIRKIGVLIQNTSEVQGWGREARRSFETKYSPQINAQSLISLYRKLLAR